MKLNNSRDFTEIVHESVAASALLPTSPRLPQLFGCSKDAGATLRRLRIAVIGVGSVGLRIAVDLARLGVGTLRLVDQKTFKQESLATHDVGPDVVGKGKALHAAHLCKAISSSTRVFVFQGSVQDLPLDAFLEIDAAALATDNLPAENETGLRCTRHRVPLFQAALHGETQTVDVRFFLNATAQSPCPNCQYTEAERSELFQQARFSCDGNGPLETAPFETAPTMSFSFLSALGAALAGHALLNFFLGVGRPLADTVLEYNCCTHRSVISPMLRNKACPCPHTGWALSNPPKPLPDCSLFDLVEAAGVTNNSCRFQIEGYHWVEKHRCRCAQSKGPGQFVPDDLLGTERCHDCGETRVLEPFHAHRLFAGNLMREVWTSPLARLGAIDPRNVRVSCQERTVLFRRPTVIKKEEL